MECEESGKWDVVKVGAILFQAVSRQTLEDDAASEDDEAMCEANYEPNEKLRCLYISLIVFPICLCASYVNLVAQHMTRPCKDLRSFDGLRERQAMR